MKDYHIYCIEDEFADHYYYKCDLLYRFIQAHQEDRNRSDLALQFNYITSHFPSDLIVAIKSKLKKSHSYKVENEGVNWLELRNKGRYLYLYIYKEKMILKCESLHVAETILFPSLRGVYPYLFVIGPLLNEYGWISPDLNKFPLIEKKEVLYSFL